MAGGPASILARSDGGSVHALAVSDQALYAGGDFGTMGTALTGPFARIDRTAAVDTTPPSITISSPQEGRHYALGTPITAAYSCDDGTGSGVATWTGPATVDAASPGTKSYTVQATDFAGNTASKTVHFVVDAPAAVDTTPPTIAIVTPAADVHYTTPAAVASQFSCANDVTVATCEDPASVDTATAGEHSFSVTATDTSGNRFTRTVRYLVVTPSGGEPPAGAGTPVPDRAGPSATQIAAALKRAIIPTGKAATIKSLRAKGSLAIASPQAHRRRQEAAQGCKAPQPDRGGNVHHARTDADQEQCEVHAEAVTAQVRRAAPARSRQRASGPPESGAGCRRGPGTARRSPRGTRARPRRTRRRAT